MSTTLPLQQTAAEAAEIREEIFSLVRRYYEVAHARKPFVPGESRLSYSGRVYDADEIVSLVASSLDYWLTLGPYGVKFERRMQEFFDSSDFVLVNSGSSANLLMVATLCAPELDRLLVDPGKPRLRLGDELITPAVTFPTTLTPIVQNQLVPVFVDCEIGTYNINPELIEAAMGPRTRGIFVPHTLGNPCDLDVIMEIAARHDLWVLEDCCDGLGSTFNGRKVGTFGDMASLSFYPAHHITMGEGGGVAINHPRLKKTSRSIRDWGRDCWCDPGKSNTCGQRFRWKLGDLPEGYDHKYIYSNLGYNLKPTDMQAAIGLVQMDKAPEFIERRRQNFWRLYDGLRPIEDRIILPLVDPRADPSPFGFPITVRRGIERTTLIRALEDAQIETRLVFGGNILRQPGFKDIPKRIHGSLEQSDEIMRRTFFVGVYPGLQDEAVDYMIDILTRTIRAL